MTHRIATVAIAIIITVLAAQTMVSNWEGWRKGVRLSLIIFGGFCSLMVCNQLIAGLERDRKGTNAKKEYNKKGGCTITVNEICKHGYRTSGRYNIQKEDYARLETGDEFNFAEYQKKFVSAAYRILWLDPFENRSKSESLIRTVGENANSGNTVIELLMNDRAAETAMFYCSVLALRDGKSDAVDAEIDVEIGRKPFTRTDGADGRKYTVESEDFIVTVSPSTLRGQSKLITVTPLKEGIDILKISSPECEYLKSIALISKKIETQFEGEKTDEDAY